MPITSITSSFLATRNPRPGHGPDGNYRNSCRREQIARDERMRLTASCRDANVKRLGPLFKALLAFGYRRRIRTLRRNTSPAPLRLVFRRSGASQCRQQAALPERATSNDCGRQEPQAKAVYHETNRSRIHEPDRTRAHGTARTTTCDRARIPPGVERY